MHVLITGGAGFIGSHLAGAHLARSDTVTVIDDLSTGRRENLADYADNDRLEFVLGSVHDASAVEPLIARADGVYHLAAAVGVQLIVDSPVETIETNVHGSEVVLRLCNRHRRRVLVMSTSEVYGKSTAEPFGEDDDVTLGSTKFTRWSYAASKIVDEFLAMAYHLQHGLEAIIARPFNTIGPRQSGAYGMVVPRFVEAALAGEPLEVYGTGQQSRCFCHVADMVDGLMALMACQEALGEVVNVGNDQPIAIAELARRIIELTGSTSEVRTISYEQAYGRPFDDMLIRRPDLSKIHRIIGYTPRFTLDETLRDIIHSVQT